MNEILKYHICSTTVASGENAIYEICDYLKEEGINKPMFVTDERVANLELFKSILVLLDNQEISYKVFDKVTPNPKDYEVMDGTKNYKEEKCDGIVGIGGGSSLDAAKCIAAMARHEGFIMEYGRSTPNRKFFVNGREKLICIPTTHGTGSEVSPHAVITNTEKHKKSDVMEKIFYPDVVILDPNVLMSLPANITTDTGVDALVHAIEVYTNKKMLIMPSPMHDSLSLTAIKLIAENLRKTVYAGDADVEARKNMQTASMLAGFVLDLDVGNNHGLTGVLQTVYPTMTHGQSVGMMLPCVMEFNAKVCPERFRNIAIAFGENVDGLNDIEASQLAVKAVRSLLQDINFAKLSDFMKDPREIDDFYKIGVSNSCIKNNPRLTTADDAKKLYLAAFEETY